MCEPSSFLQSCLPVAKSLLGISYISYFSPVLQASCVTPTPPRAPYTALGMPFAPPRPYKSFYGRYCVPYSRETARMASATTSTLCTMHVDQTSCGIASLQGMLLNTSGVSGLRRRRRTLPPPLCAAASPCTGHAAARTPEHGCYVAHGRLQHGELEARGVIKSTKLSPHR
jgi:hypothetical protein